MKKILRLLVASLLVGALAAADARMTFHYSVDGAIIRGIYFFALTLIIGLWIIKHKR